MLLARVFKLLGLFCIACMIEAYIIPSVLILLIISNRMRFEDNAFWQIVAAGATVGSTTLMEVISNCKEVSNGHFIDIGTCAASVLSSTVATGMAVHRYRTTGHAEKRDELELAMSKSFGGKPVLLSSNNEWILDMVDVVEGVDNANFKRDADRFDEGETILIVHDWASELRYNNATNRLEEDDNLGSIHALVYFRSDNSTLITPLNSSTISYFESGLHKRYGYTGYDLTKGTLTVYCNSDPVASWDDAVNWANALYPDAHLGYAYLHTKLEEKFGSTFDVLGFAPNNKVNGKDGQFIVRSYKNKWTNWETGLNWCFGPYLSNCEGTNNEYIDGF